ncbi:protein PLASTID TRANSCRIPTIONALLY ACTIVE 7 isoform X2 [Tripterygium wilfordii]|uniref:protein PLASTID TRANSCRIPTIONALLY ACTIVE 7 isoform X2 n=1 Tax=Tripterygium wilfordii TaxID=458696 RepID=UPI0018F81FA8|nr:protein PLASTID TRANSCRIPTIONALLY ACTIVE 7 isoform X2 [Tripterygium wilfordii]
MALSALPFSFSSVSSRTELKAGNSWNSTFSTKSQPIVSQSPNNSSGRRVWRRRKLTKKDDMRKYRMERTPFLEEQVRVINERGGLMSMDIERLLLSEDNRFDFVNEVAAEAISYVESNRDEYGGTKKAILHVLSNRMNDAGFSRPEAYAESDPFKPGPGYLKEELT